MTHPEGAVRDDRRARRRWLTGVLVVGAIYLGCYLRRGWFPHDEGALGQTAERVLAGEVPHRDFDEPYTGLLTYVHAGAFAIGGTRLVMLRLPLFAGTLLWLAAVFGIARRSVAPRTAAAVTLLALLWSVPNYPASMPSWYNLFCATFVALALMRWLEARTARWLFAAGVAGGISFLIKLSGLFAVAGGLLFLVYATQEEGRSGRASGPRQLASAAAVTVALAVFVGLLWRSIAPLYQARPIFHFVLPGGVLALALLSREWARGAPASWLRMRSLIAASTPYLLGVALPVVVFAGLYAVLGGIPQLVGGVFVAPFRRLAYANMRPPAPYWVLAAVPLGILLRPRGDASDPKWRRAGFLVCLLLGFVLMLASTDSFPHRFVWQTLRSLAPILALVGSVVVSWPSLTARWSPGARDRFVLLVMVATLASLVQFPFSSPTYFLYVAPLCLLALSALLAGMGGTPPPLIAALVGFYAVFAILLVTPGSVVGLAYRYETPHDTEWLTLPRAGLRMLPADATLYRELIPRVQEVAGRGEIWAGPDAPEVYFLGGFRNRSRSIFDFLGSDGEGFEALTQALLRPQVTAVIVNTAPSFSPRVPASLLERVRREFPGADTIGRFELRWRK